MNVPQLDYCALFNASPNPYLVLDRALNIVGANRAYLAATKRELKDIVGRWAWDAFPTDAETLKRSIASFERVIRTRQPDTMALLRFDIPRPDSEGGGFEVRYWSITHSPVLDPAGEVELVLQHPIDVTELQKLRESTRDSENAPEARFGPAVSGIVDRAQSVHEANLRLKDEIEARRHAELQLEDSERRYRALFNNRTSAVAHLRVVTDPEGKPVDYYFDAINDQWEQLMGLRREAVVGRLGTEVFPGLREQEWDPVAHLGRIALDGGEGIFEIHFRPTGQWISIYAYSPKQGECTVIFTDISERKAVEAEVRRLNAELEERVRRRTAELAQANEALVTSNIELQRFAYVASHDLQTPLRTIVGLSQILQARLEDSLDPDNRTLLDQVIEATRRMHTLIRDLLSYSRVESQARPLEPVDFGRILQSVLPTLKQPIRETGAEITHGDMPMVLGDPGQLAQVLQNLIENGIKYHGPDRPRIHLQAERGEKEWVFSVRDNGIGIAPRHFEKIFDVFQRLHTQQAYPGTGIGLAICRRVIERHGGRIWLESEPGKGSTFFFSIPAVPAMSRAERGATEDSA